MIVTEREKMKPITDEISIPMLERISTDKAKPMQDCPFPRCEECDKYHGHWCTVPMVVSKQKWLLTEDLFVSMEKRIAELENLVTEEILGSKRCMKTANDPNNLTWEDCFKEDDNG